MHLKGSPEIPKPCIFKGWHLDSGSLGSSNPEYFLKKLNKDFQMHFNILPILRLIFPVFRRKYKKWPIFKILIAITLAVNTITRQMTLFSSSTPWALSVAIIHFFVSRPSVQFHEVGPLDYVLVFKIYIKHIFTCQRWHFSLLT